MILEINIIEDLFIRILFSYWIYENSESIRNSYVSVCLVIPPA